MDPFDIYYKLVREGQPRPRMLPLEPMRPMPIPTAPVPMPKPPPPKVPAPTIRPPDVRYFERGAPTEFVRPTPFQPAGLQPPARGLMPIPEARPIVPPGELPAVPKLPAPKYDPITVGRGGRLNIPESYFRLPEAERAAAINAEARAALQRMIDYRRYVRQSAWSGVKDYMNRAIWNVKLRPMAYGMGLATPTAMEGMLAITSLSMLYLLLTGERPKSTRPQVAQVVEQVTADVKPPSTPILPEIQNVLQATKASIAEAAANSRLDDQSRAALKTYVQLIDDIGNDVGALSQAKLSLNGPTEAASYMGQVNRTEAVLADRLARLGQLKSFFAVHQMGAQVVAIDNLMDSMGKFLAAVASSRGAA